MKAFSLERRHLRQIAVRRLTMISGMGALLSFTFGAWIVPWIVEVVPWLIHQIPWWHQPGTFPNLLHFIAAPDLTLGLFWLGYYALAYLWAATTLSPRQERAQRARLVQKDREAYSEWSLPPFRYDDDTSYMTPARPRKEERPLSQAWPGELKHQLVERCYDTYRKALQRFHPPPIDLKTPTTFFYHKGGPLEWKEGGTLILPEEVLTPERIHEILPFLAIALADYNSEAFTPEETHGYPDHVPLAGLLFLTGNFLWLPVTYKHDIEAQGQADSDALKKQRVLERDEFAVYLGQGPALEHQLRRIEEDLKQRSEMDRSVPTLIERIGRLEVLNEQERQEMRKLGLKPKQAPLIQGTAPRQLKQGKEDDLP